jgi:hypothetical protein
MSEDYVIIDANLAFKCLYSGRTDLRERIGPGRKQGLRAKGFDSFFEP